VLDYVGELLASPVDVAETKLVDSSPLHAFIWKVGWDERKGWMSFVRIYSGKPVSFSFLHFLLSIFLRHAEEDFVPAQPHARREGKTVTSAFTICG
jgi:hypothetical protein